MNENKIFYNSTSQKMMLNGGGVVFSSAAQAFIHARNGGGITISAQDDVKLKGKNITLGSNAVSIKGKEAIEMTCGASSMVLDGTSNETHLKSLKVRKESPANIPIDLPDADRIAAMAEGAKLLNEFIEIIDGHPHQPYPEDYRQALIDRFQDADLFWRRMIVEYMCRNRVGTGRRSGGGLYVGGPGIIPGLNSISMNWSGDMSNRGNGLVYFHEIGHFIDFTTGFSVLNTSPLSRRDGEFGRLVRQDFNNFLQPMAESFFEQEGITGVSTNPSDILRRLDRRVYNRVIWDEWPNEYYRLYRHIEDYIIGRAIIFWDEDTGESQLATGAFGASGLGVYNMVTDLFQGLSRVPTRGGIEQIRRTDVPMPDGSTSNFRGRSTDYFNNFLHGTEMVYVEAFAHFFAAMFSPDDAALMEEFFPDSFAHFQRMMRDRYYHFTCEAVFSESDEVEAIQRRSDSDRNQALNRVQEMIQEMINDGMSLNLGIDLENICSQVNTQNIILTTGGNGGQAVILTPSLIIIKCGNDTFIRLSSNGGIRIISSDRILINSANDISLISEDIVTIAAMENMKLNSEDVKIDMISDKIELESEKVKVN